ncbi:MAG TPA: hypothetical protein VF171_00975 [Trueperaceae bacterium]
MTQVVNENERRRINLQLFAEDPPADEPPADDPSDGNDDPPAAKTYDEEYVKQLRGEAAKYRKRAKELEEKMNTLPQEVTGKVLKALGLEPDPEKNFDQQLAEANRKAQEATEKANERLVRAEVKSVAADLGLVDAEAAYALMDRSNVQVADDGTVDGVKEALEALAEAKPYLKAQPKGNGNVGSGTNPGGDGNSGIKNPWLPDNLNLTEQGRIMRENPELAARLKAEAGKK